MSMARRAGLRCEIPSTPASRLVPMVVKKKPKRPTKKAYVQVPGYGCTVGAG